LRSSLAIAEKNFQFFPEHEASVMLLRRLSQNNNR
jgi:hypothetical protein